VEETRPRDWRLGRDINTKNILIAADMTAKIADFGAAVRSTA
jgi:serine/threonine protein kinase